MTKFIFRIWRRGDVGYHDVIIMSGSKLEAFAKIRDIYNEDKYEIQKVGFVFDNEMHYNEIYK